MVRQTSRRAILRLSGLGLLGAAGSAWLAACGGQPPSPTAAPKPTEAPKPAAEPTKPAAPAAAATPTMAAAAQPKPSGGAPVEVR
jgi:hypothetical protein